MSFLEESQHLNIPFAHIQLATDNFSTLIGKGGYGQVYKGQLLLSGTLTSVAVKRLDHSVIAGQGLKEFLTEIHLLCRYKHPNLISLLGFCNEGNEKILVYEYAERGSLDKYLSDRTLTWMQRIRICLDAARGLDYLHNQVAPNHRVIHRDIKSANILLDHNWKAMISDLGLSKLGRANEGDTFLITNACGTLGYCDPKYIDTGILTKESDIYSFGVVLFEVLCGRLCFMNVNNEHRFLAPLAQSYYESKKLDEIMNPDLKKQMNTNSKNMLSMIAYQCVHKDRRQRPQLNFIIKELLKALDCQFDDNRCLVDVITEPSQCCFLWLPENSFSTVQVSRLIYTNSGSAILALAANGVHKLWKWQPNEKNAIGKATTIVAPQLWQPTVHKSMINDISDKNPNDVVSCFALPKHDTYLMSASGGRVSVFHMMTFKTMITCMSPPPTATFLAIHPQDNNIIVIGMDDSSIQVYNIRVDKVKAKRKGHSKRITGLAFSNMHNVLVSSGADSKLCVWSIEGWMKQMSTHLQIPDGRVAPPLVDTQVQFHNDQTQLLVVQETQIAIYNVPKLECLKHWVPPDMNWLITHATYSCDSQSIYASFEDGSVGIFTASTLILRCRISSTAYLSTNPNSRVYPLVIAAHPTKANQFALGLSDGGVMVLEPLESEGKWGTSPALENNAGPSITTTGATSTTDQTQR